MQIIKLKELNVRYLKRKPQSLFMSEIDSDENLPCFTIDISNSFLMTLLVIHEIIEHTKWHVVIKIFFATFTSHLANFQVVDHNEPIVKSLTYNLTCNSIRSPKKMARKCNSWWQIALSNFRWNVCGVILFAELNIDALSYSITKLLNG